MARTHQLEREQLLQRPPPASLRILRGRAEFGGNYAAFSGFSRDHTHADRDADRRAHRVPAVAIWAAAELAHAHHGLATRRARFVDEQESGPFALWRHTHGFEARGHATLVRDTVQYREPLGPLGALAHLLFVERTMNRIFDFRREEIARALNTGASASPVLHVASDAP
jgi:hypothetical protein